MAFKDDNWQVGYHRFIICTIALADPDAVRDTTATGALGASPTLRFCDDTRVRTYDSNDYYPGLLTVSIRMAGNIFGTDVSDSDGSIEIAATRYHNQQQAGAAPQEAAPYFVKMPQLQRNYVWEGASVTLQVICERPDGTQTAQQIFTGLVYSCPYAGDRIGLTVVESKEYIVTKPDSDGPPDATSNTRSIVNRTDHPNAPLASIGLPLPIVYANDPISPFTSGGLATNPRLHRNLWPAVMTESLYDATDSRTASLNLLVSNNLGTQTGAQRVFLWHPEINTMSWLQNTGTGGVTNAYTIDWWITTDSYGILYLNPNNFVAKTAGVSNPDRAFDGKPDTYASLVNAGTTQTLDLRIPFPSPLGKIVGSRAFIILEAGTGVGATDADVNGDFGYWNATDGAYHHGTSTDLTKANLNNGGAINGTAMSNSSSSGYNEDMWQSWQFQGRDSGTVEDCYFRVRITSNGATCNVIACGLRIDHEPKDLTFYSGRRGTNVYDNFRRTLK